MGPARFGFEAPRVVDNTRIGDHAFEPLTESARPSQQMTHHVERIDRYPLGEVQTKIGVLRGGAEQLPNLVVGGLGIRAPAPASDSESPAASSAAP